MKSCASSKTPTEKIWLTCSQTISIRISIWQTDIIRGTAFRKAVPLFHMLRIIKKDRSLLGVFDPFSLVKAVRIELTSESISTRLSPSAAFRLSLRFPVAERQAKGRPSPNWPCCGPDAPPQVSCMSTPDPQPAGELGPTRGQLIKLRMRSC